MIFVDTVAWLYLFDKRQSGPEAKQARKFLDELDVPLATSDLVIEETHKWLIHHGRPAHQAQRVIQKLVGQELALILEINPQDREASLKYLEKYADQKLSYTDALTVALMERHRIQQVFSFDKHFLLFPQIKRMPD